MRISFGWLPGSFEEEFRLYHFVVACDGKTFITSLTKSDFLATNEINILATEAYYITFYTTKKGVRSLIWSYAGSLFCGDEHRNSRNSEVNESIHRGDGGEKINYDGEERYDFFVSTEWKMSDNKKTPKNVFWFYDLSETLRCNVNTSKKNTPTRIYSYIKNCVRIKIWYNLSLSNIESHQSRIYWNHWKYFWDPLNKKLVNLQLFRCILCILYLKRI